MKSLLLALLALSWSWMATAQQNPPQNKVLYRGFENILSHADLGTNPKGLVIRGLENVEIKTNKAGEFVAYPGAAKIAKIAVYDGEKLIKTISFDVFNRPVNVLYFCGLESGQEIRTPCTELSVGLPKTAAQRPTNYVVESWEVIIPGIEFGSRGTGAQITDFHAVFDRIVSEETLVLTVVYSDPEGIQRKTEGTWTVKK